MQSSKSLINRTWNVSFVLAFLAVCFVAGSAFGQGADPVAAFEKNRKLFKVKKYAEGEDAQSGSTYIQYLRKGVTVKLRIVWSSGATREQQTDDVYFEKGKAVLMIRYPRSKKFFRTAESGAKLSLVPDEILYFSDGKMIRWSEKGKDVPNSDPRWAETVAQATETVNAALEGFNP